MYERDPVKMEVYLDGEREPIGVFRPPATFELDTTKLADGPHRLLIKAYDRAGMLGIREMNFIVRNGPGIAVVGLKEGDIVEGRIPVLLNAYAGTHDENWEPTRAETPAPIPTWAWLLFLLVVIWAGYYWFDAGFFPPEEYANSPTFSSPSVIAASAQRVGVRPTPRAEFDWQELGARVYGERCQVCHGSAGEGVPRFVPTLVGSPRLLAPDATEPVRRILFGTPGVAPDTAPWNAWMPPFARDLSDSEVAAVASHIRNSWGNRAPPVLPEQVAEIREAGQAR